jgi:hypothetical protein
VAVIAGGVPVVGKVPVLAQDITKGCDPVVKFTVGAIGTTPLHSDCVVGVRVYVGNGAFANIIEDCL